MFLNFLFFIFFSLQKWVKHGRTTMPGQPDLNQQHACPRRTVLFVQFFRSSSSCFATAPVYTGVAHVFGAVFCICIAIRKSKANYATPPMLQQSQFCETILWESFSLLFFYVLCFFFFCSRVLLCVYPNQIVGTVLRNSFIFSDVGGRNTTNNLR